MKLRIAAITEGRNTDMVAGYDKKYIEIISGKLGSICYLEKDYDDIAEEDDEKEVSRIIGLILDSLDESGELNNYLA